MPKKAKNITSVFEKEASAKKPSNPESRLEIRADFPKTLATAETEEILRAVKKELRKQGTSLGRVKKINIAYPRKHPRLYPEHYNCAQSTAESLRDGMRELAPRVRWVITDEICETLHLDRSSNQTSLHALMSRQIYDIHKPDQKDYTPFGQQKEFFIVVDGTIEQGTTIANLISYITHNGGSVLSAAASTTYLEARHLVQQRKKPKEKFSLSGKFSDAARNTGRLPELAEAFSCSAKKRGHSWTPQQCLDMLEARLKAVGNSLFALTDNECDRLLSTVRGERGYETTIKSFPGLIRELDRAAKKKKRPAPARG